MTQKNAQLDPSEFSEMTICSFQQFNFPACPKTSINYYQIKKFSQDIIMITRSKLIH